MSETSLGSTNLGKYKITRLILLQYIRLVIFIINRRTPSRQIPERSLIPFYRNVYSQAGQDGILEEILFRLGITQGKFIEFGAWDGEHLSNCKYLVQQGWTGVFIEGDSARFKLLEKNYPSKDFVKINRFVGYRDPATLVQYGSNLKDILLDSEASRFLNEIDYLSIDVDGVDLEIALSMGISPKIITVEGGSVFNPEINVPFPDYASNFQHPLAYIFIKLKELGYVPVCFHQDVYAVRSDLVGAELDEFIEKSPKEFFKDSWHFLSLGDREWQFWKRYTNQGIKTFEISQTGNFSLNPIVD